MNTYAMIKLAEPRLVHLERAAMLAVAAGIPADEAYTDAKPFIACLVGWNRGSSALVDRPSPLQHRYARAITGTVFGADDQRLSTPQAFQVVLESFYDMLSAADQRWSA